MSEPAKYTPEYLAHMERRYVDLKQIYEAVVSYYPPNAYEENYLFDTIICEFNYLAHLLGYEDEDDLLERLYGKFIDDVDDEDADDEGDRTG
ncbi:MAG TPA: hypothetical protein PLQ56_23130 [Aggregatilineales bacterium]|nr:hypothetical protein [Anaerolineae bacterium]HUN09517.1 hypothetical protein [Aggregatilineales bacterium]